MALGLGTVTCSQHCQDGLSGVADGRRAGRRNRNRTFPCPLAGRNDPSPTGAPISQPAWSTAAAGLVQETGQKQRGFAALSYGTSCRGGRGTK